MKHLIRKILYKCNLITSWDFYGLNDATIGAINLQAHKQYKKELSQAKGSLKYYKHRAKHLHKCYLDKLFELNELKERTREGI